MWCITTGRRYEDYSVSKLSIYGEHNESRVRPSHSLLLSRFCSRVTSRDSSKWSAFSQAIWQCDELAIADIFVIFTNQLIINSY